MIIKYNTEKLKSIIKDFSNITGLTLSLRDTNFETIYNYYYNTPAFCYEIQKSKEGKEKCYCSDNDIFQKCMQSKKFESHTCHAGLTDCVMPIIKNDIIVGYIIFGRIRTAENFSDIEKYLTDLNVDFDILKKSYYNVALFDKNQIKSISDLMSFILFENAIEIEYNEFIKNVTDYIDENLRKDLSVTKLCNVMHISKNYLYKNFSDSFGCTVNEYITKQRIKKANKLLKGTDEPVYKISENVGINDCTYFCRLYKKQTGLSPAEYRKRSI